MQTSPNPKSLVPQFGLGMAIILVISNIIGSGVFKKVAPMSEHLQSPGWVLAAWALAGVITIFGVLTTAEAAAMFPHSGGAFSWLRQMYGEFFGYSFGWACFVVIRTAAIASIAYVFAESLGSLLTLPNLPDSLVQAATLGGFSPLSNMGVKMVAILLILALTWVNIRGTNWGGGVSQVFTISVVVGILLITFACLFSGQGEWANLGKKGGQFAEKGLGDTMTLVGAVILAMQGAFWAYEGWLSLGYIGEEVKDPQRNLPRALILGILAVMLVYLSVNFAYLYVMPVDELLALKAQNPNSIAAVLVMQKVVGNSGAVIVAVIILISTLGCTNSSILTAARIYYAMSKAGEFFPSAAQTHPTYGTPHKALTMQAVWAVVLVLSGSFDTLTDLLIFAAFMYYGAITLGVMILRNKRPDIVRPYKTWGYPVVPALFVLFCVVFVLYTFYNTPLQSLIGLLLILSGIPFYLYFKRNLQRQA